jgi:predicted RNA-binding Zn ribbon-like protein
MTFTSWWAGGFVETKDLVFNPREWKDRRLSLDFANTIEWRDTNHPDESIRNYPDLLAWSRNKGILEEGDRRYLIEEAERHPIDADAVLTRALALREAVYHIVSAVAHGRTARETDFVVFNAELSRVLANSEIIHTTDGFKWKYIGERNELDRMLWPVILDATYLLTSDVPKRIGECAAEGCTWLFIDKSRNRSRQWCSMGSCGNRAKARRFYQRKQAARKE